MSPRSRSDPPHRLRITVPASDTSVLRWLELQENPSISLRMLVRASIERDGYTDVLTRPVDQLPRRGRQAAEPARPAPAEPDAPETAAPPAAAPAAREAVRRDPGRSTGTGTKSDPPARAPKPNPKPQKQYSIDEIMSSTRQ